MAQGQADTQKQNQLLGFSLNSSAQREILQKSCAPVIRRVMLKFRVPDPDSIRSVDPDPFSESGSGFRSAKMTHKSRKKFRNFMF
jgi:hypothetical protein